MELAHPATVLTVAGAAVAMVAETATVAVTDATTRDPNGEDTASTAAVSFPRHLNAYLANAPTCHK